MDLSKLSQEQLQSRCAFCHQIIPDNQECFGVGARGNPEAVKVLRAYEGAFFPFPLGGGRVVIAIVVPQDSDAKRAGNDFYFRGCSESCVEKLRNELKKALSGTVDPLGPDGVK